MQSPWCSGAASLVHPLHTTVHMIAQLTQDKIVFTSSVLSNLTTYPPSRQRLQIGPNAHWLDSVWKRQAHFATIVEHLP